MLIKTARTILRELATLKVKARDFRGQSYSESRLKKTSAFPAKEQLREYLLKREKPRFFFSPDLKAELIAKLPLPAKEFYLKQAEAYLSHQFNLLGSGPVSLGEKINWQQDFIRKVSWEARTYYTKVPIIRGDGSDIKIPWELARFQHLPVLGKAYWLSGEEKYPQEFVNLHSDFIKQNPVPYGANWACPMEAGIRAVNWIAGLYFFLDSKVLSPEFLWQFLFCLWQTGQFIRLNLEQGFPRGNHYLADLTALFFLGVLFPEFKEASEWREFSFANLEKELEQQVFSDGVDYEGSTSYHRMVTEFFLCAAILGELNRLKFSEHFKKKLFKMLKFVLYYSKPDGTAPLVGDNDNGRLLILSESEDLIKGLIPPERRFCDHRHLLAAGGDFFTEPVFLKAGEALAEDALWLGANLSKLRNKPQPAPLNCLELTNHSFPVGGYYFLRKAGHYLMVNGLFFDPQAPSGHFHNDKLSFELYAGDKTFILDPGTFCYTSDEKERNRFRQTSWHNTATVNKEEQNPILTGKFFYLPQKAKVKINAYKCTKQRDYIELEHSGYIKDFQKVKHLRRFYFERELLFWRIKDEFSGRGVHQIDIYFHFAPLELKLLTKHLFVTQAQGWNLAFYILIRDWQLIEETGWVAFGYGEKVKAPVLRFKKTGVLPFAFDCLLYPFKGELKLDYLEELAKGV